MTDFEKVIVRKQVGSEGSDSGLLIIVWEEMTNLEEDKSRVKKKSVKPETAKNAFVFFLGGGGSHKKKGKKVGIFHKFAAPYVLLKSSMERLLIP